MKLKIPILFLLFIFISISPVFAAISIDWGGPTGQPLFTVANMAPGQSVSRTVKVLNGDPITQDLTVTGLNKSDPGSLADVLLLIITEGVHTLYGPSPLTQFFTHGAPLSQLKSNAQTTYNFTVLFASSAGNTYQNKLLTFDLNLGTTAPIPTRCNGLRDPQLIRDCVDNNVRYRYYLFLQELNRRLAELAARLSSLRLPLPR